MLRRTPVRGLARAIAYALATAGLLAALGLAAVTVVPAVLGWGSFVVLSGSMEPAIPVGSVVVTRPVDTSQLHPGDVITFYNNDIGQRITHRVVRLELNDGQLGLRTRGEANPADDVWLVKGDDVVGKVIASVPLAGSALMAIDGLPARLALVGVLLVNVLRNSFKRA